MIPISDTARAKKTPIINRIIILINIAVFVYQIGLANGNFIDLKSLESIKFIYQWAFIPANLTNDLINGVITIFTSMFMHAGLLHIAGNLLFLWVFGDNIEDELGHFPFLVFYLAGGVAAALIQAGLGNNPDIPMLGASGAISAILGAYLLLHPFSWVTTFIPPFFLVPLPAFVFLPIWILLQYQDLQSKTSGIAIFAHLGGFFFGIIIAWLTKKGVKSKYTNV